MAQPGRRLIENAHLDIPFTAYNRYVPLAAGQGLHLAVSNIVPCVLLFVTPSTSDVTLPRSCARIFSSPSFFSLSLDRNEALMDLEFVAHNDDGMRHVDMSHVAFYTGKFGWSRYSLLLQTVITFLISCRVSCPCV